jgi:hypothetical protein
VQIIPSCSHTGTLATSTSTTRDRLPDWGSRLGIRPASRQPRFSVYQLRGLHRQGRSTSCRLPPP